MNSVGLSSIQDPLWLISLCVCKHCPSRSGTRRRSRCDHVELFYFYCRSSAWYSQVSPAPHRPSLRTSVQSLVSYTIDGCTWGPELSISFAMALSRNANRYSYLRAWYESLRDLDLHAIIFHDGLDQGFIQALQTPKIKFVFTTLNNRSVHDWLFFTIIRQRLEWQLLIDNKTFETLTVEGPPMMQGFMHTVTICPQTHVLLGCILQISQASLENIS